MKFHKNPPSDDIWCLVQLFCALPRHVHMCTILLWKIKLWNVKVSIYCLLYVYISVIMKSLKNFWKVSLQDWRGWISWWRGTHMFLHCLQSTAKLSWMTLMVTLEYLYDVVQFSFQLGACRIQNLKRMYMLILIQCTSFQTSCYCLMKLKSK
jgi:hypothetical protein